MVKTKYYYLTCSRCQRRFRGSTRTEALSKLRKHLWKEHSDWMKRRIKAGIKKAHKASENPFAKWIGFAERPVIEKVTGLPYEEVRTKVLDFFVSMLLGGVKKP